MPTRRYEIDLIINSQQVTQAANAANQAQNTVQQGAKGVAGAIQGAVDSIAKYMVGIQGLRMAWNLAQRASEEYMRQAEKAAERQKTAADKGLDLDRSLREYYQVNGAFKDSSKIPALYNKAMNFGADSGLVGAKGVQFLTAADSELAQYYGKAGTPGKTMTEKEGEEFRKLLAQHVAATGGDPMTAVRSARGIIRSTDWNQFGDKAAESAFAEYVAVNQIMQTGSGQQNRNNELFAKMASQAIQIDPKESRFNGPDKYRKAAAMMRGMAEVDPEQSEMMMRNYLDLLGQMGKKDVRKALVGAGIPEGMDPVEATKHLSDYIDSRREATGYTGTASQWVRNVMKGQMRGAMGGFAAIVQQKTGQFENAMNEGKDINADTAVGNLNALRAALPSLTQETMQARQDREQIIMGRYSMDLQKLLPGMKAARESKMGLMDDRSFNERGGIMNTFENVPFIGRKWDDEEDDAKFAFYKQLNLRSDPAAYKRYQMMDPAERERAATLAYSDFYYARPDQRDRMLIGAGERYMKATGRTTEQLLEDILKEFQQQRGATMDNQGKNMVAPNPQGGLIGH